MHHWPMLRLRAYNDYNDILRRITSCLSLARACSGTFYRSAGMRYATANDIVSGQGSRIHGGRWNSAGSFPTVYASNTPETAMAESLAHHRFYGLSVAQALPRVFVALEVRLQSILYVTSGMIRRRLRIAQERLLQTDWRGAQDLGNEAITQALGRACYEAGLEGLVVPSSATATGYNIVVFPERLMPGSTLRVVDADLLRT